MLPKEIAAKLAESGLISAKAIKNIKIDGDSLLIDISLGYAHQSIKNEIATKLSELIRKFIDNQAIRINIDTQIAPHVAKQGLSPLPNVKNIIAVASGKGGVGKSTLAVNLALGLQKEGACVGLLDADIYGPSQPTMLGTQGERPVIKNKTIQPLIRHQIQSISMGNLIAANAALAWRGPMLGKALEQLMYDTQWDNLDYMIVDLPPGTGDVALTLCQKIPVSAAVIVTTPQDLALLDVRRACEMFNKLTIPILGVVENMSTYHCEQCGHEARIFGKGGAEQLSKEFNTALLARIPLDIRIRELTDSGFPPVVKDANSECANLFLKIARLVGEKLANQPQAYSFKFPKIVVEHGDNKE